MQMMWEEGLKKRVTAAAFHGDKSVSNLESGSVSFG